MNQKHCRGCPHLDFNEMSDEMYCKLRDYEPIRLRWHKHRPNWCPLVKQKGGRMTYLCPKCKGIMTCVSTASIPPITTYQCIACGYVSKPEKELVDCVTLPRWLWSDDERRE